MADLKFKIIADDSALGVSLQKTNNSLNKVSETSKKVNSEMKSGFKQSAQEADKFNKELEDTKIPLDATATSLKGLKQQIKEYQNAAIAAGETSPIGQEFLKKAGEAKDRLGDIQNTVKGFGSDTKTFDGLIQGATTAAAAFSIFHGVSALVGDENKNLQQTLVKLGAATSILTGIQQIQKALQKDEPLRLLITEIRTKAVAASKLIYATSLGIASGGLSAYTVASDIAAAATKALLGPLGIAIGIIGAVAGAFLLLSDETGEVTQEMRDNTKAINENAIAQLELENRIQSLRDKRDELLGDISSDETERREVTREFQVKRLKDAEKFEQDKFDIQEKFKKEGLAGLKDNIAATTKLFEDYEKVQINTGFEFNEKIAAINISANKAAKEKENNDNKDKANIKKEADDKFLADKKKQREEELQLEKEFAQMLVDLEKKSTDARINLSNPREAVELRRTQQLKELADYKENLRLKNVAVNKTFLFTAEQEEQFSLLKQQIEKKSADDLNKITEDGLNKGKELQAKNLEDVKKNLELKIAIINASQKREGISQIEFEKIKNIQTLEAQRESYLQQIELLKDKTDIDSKILVEGLRKALADVDAELHKGKKLDLAALLGMTPDELGKVKERAKAFLGEVVHVFDEQINAQQQLLDKKKQLNDLEIQEDDRKLNSLQGRLANELELRRQGFASNIDAVRAEIAAVEKARQEALIKQQQIIAQQAKIDKLKRIEENANQISAILSAAANIYAGWSTTPFIGQILGAAQIALMIGGFIAAKAKMRQATQLRYGGELDGPTHEEGGIPLYEAEGGEFVTTREQTKKHKKLLKAINEDDFSTLKMTDLAPLLKGTGVVLNMDAANKISRENTLVRNSQADMFGSNGVEKRLENIEKSVNGFFNHYKSKPTENISGNVKTIKKGNITKIIRKG